MSHAEGARGVRRGRDESPSEPAEGNTDEEESLYEEEDDGDAEDEEVAEEDDEEEDEEEEDGESEQSGDGEDEDASIDDDEESGREERTGTGKRRANAEDDASPTDADRSLASAAGDDFVDDEAHAEDDDDGDHGEDHEEAGEEGEAHEEGEEDGEDEAATPSPPPSAAPSLPLFSASASTSAAAASAPFMFSGSTAFAIGQGGGGSATASAPFTFGAPLSAPSLSAASPYSFSAASSSASSSATSAALPAPASSSTTGTSSFTTTAPGVAASSAASSTSSAPSAASRSPPASGPSAIVVPTAARAVSGVWGAGNELFLFADAASNSAPPHRNVRTAPSDSNVFRFQWPGLHGESGVLVHSWHAVFSHVQQQARLQAVLRTRKSATRTSAAPLSPIEWRTFLLNQSRCYRAELDACLLRAAQALSSVSTQRELVRHNVSTAEFHAQLLLLESAASTWHLFELVCLDPHENLTVQLVDWLQRSVSAPRTAALRPDSDEWWMAALQLLVQGRLPAVVELITAAVKSPSSSLSFLSSSAVTALVDLLQTLPSMTARVTSVHALVSLVRDYQESVQHLAASTSAFQSHPYLPLLLSILAGDEAALVAVCDDWTALLVAELLFVQPQTSKQELPDLVQRCVLALDEKDKENGVAVAAAPPLLAQIRQHVLCFRVHSAVLVCDQLFELPSFTAHLVDLLHLAGVMPTLQQPDKPLGKSQQHAQPPSANGWSALELSPRDWYVWQYVASILHHERLWTLTPDYINAIGAPSNPSPAPAGRPFSPIHALCSSLLSRPCPSAARLLQLLSLCAAHQLPAFVSERLCEHFASRMLREGQTGAAVYWFERAGDSGGRRIQQIATRLLDLLILRIRGDDGAENDDAAMGRSDLAGSSPPMQEAEAAMEAVLDNVSDAWFSAESGCLELILLAQWRDYLLLRPRQHEARSARQHEALHARNVRELLNVFQLDRMPPLQANDTRDDADGSESVEAGDVLARSQKAVGVLLGLLTEPQVEPVHGAVQYTPQSLHLALFRELSAMLQGVDALADCSTAALEAALNALNRCELSWRWEQWKISAGVGQAEVSAIRRLLLRHLRSALLIDESAKRMDVRV